MEIDKEYLELVTMYKKNKRMRKRKYKKVRLKYLMKEHLTSTSCVPLGFL